MADDINKIRDRIRERARDLEAMIAAFSAELEQMNAMLAALGAADDHVAENAHGKPPRSQATRRKPSRGARGGKPAKASAAKPKRVTRAEQAGQVIAAKPGLTASQVAREMGIKPSYLYRVLPVLEAQGKVTKRGDGYHPAAPAASTEGGL